MAFTETFGGTTIYPSDVSYRAISLSANQELSWPLEVATSGNVVAQIMDVTPSAGGFTITMPPGNEASPGETALFFNAGAHNFTVADNLGNTIVTITPGLAYQVYLTTNTTVAGTWRSTQFGAGTSSATAGSLVGAGIKAINTTLNQSMAVTSLAVNYTAGASDRSSAILWTGGAGTVTLPAVSSVGNDWFFHIRNGGGGAVSLVTTGGELINGTSTVDFNPGDSAIIVCDGSGYFTIGFGQAPEFLFDYVSIDLTSQSSPYTLAGSNLNRIAYQFSGTLTTNMEIIVPATIQQYWVGNFTTGGSYTVTIKTSGGTGVIVARDARAILYCNGTDVVTADTGGISIPLLVSQGGTGATNASAARTNLGATSIGNALFTAVDEATARNAILAAKSGANSDITSLSGLTTPLSVPQGGSGVATLTANGVVLGNGASALSATAVGTTGQVLVGNTGAAPSWATLTGIGVTSFSGGTTGLTPSSATTGAITLAGTLGVANGGTGATTLSSGYLVKGNGTSAVSASVVYDDGTNVGIGTSSPGAKLNVVGGNIAVDADSRKIGYITDGTAANTGYMVPYDGSGFLSLHSNFATAGIKFHTGTSNLERMRINSTGDVLVGTTSSTFAFSGRGVVAVNGSSEALYGFNIGGAGVGYLFHNGTNMVLSNDQAGGALIYNTVSTERMRIDSSGNVGIGTTGPIGKLQVSSADGSLIVGYSASNYYDADTHYFRNSATTVTTYLVPGASATFLSTNAALPLAFGTNNSERMRIDSSGNVGIGTSSPSTKFQVNQTGGDFFVGAAFAKVENTSGASATLFLSDTTDSASIKNIGSALAFSGSGTERMRITAAGDVGIGTPNPSGYGKLAVVGGNLGVSEEGATVTTLRANLSVCTVGAYNATGAALTFSTSSSGGGEVERMRIDASGNVMVGTTSALSKFTVQQGADGYDQSITLSRVGADRGTIFLNATGNTMNFGRGTATSMSIDSSGNVGIGTSSPGAQLHLAGPAEIKMTNTTNTSGYDIGLLGGSSDANAYVYQRANAALIFGTNNNDRMRIDASGNVGIGTTSPSGKFNISAPGLGQISYFFSGTSVNYTDVDTNIFRSAAGSERMRINSSGNVGIGTSTANNRLVVDNGGITVQFSGSPSLDLGNAFMHVVGNPSTAGGFRLGMGWNVGFDGTNWRTGADSVNNGGAYIASNYGAGSLDFYTVPATGGTSQSISDASFAAMKRMSIDYLGNVGIGTSSPALNLVVSNAGAAGIEFSPTGGLGGGTYIQCYNRSTLAYVPNTNYAASQTWYAGLNRAMDIDSSGNLLVGKTAFSSTTVGFEASGSSGEISTTMASAVSAQSTLNVYSTGAAAYRFYVGMNGVINCTSTSINAISDIRLKENVRDLDTGLDTILALKPRRFDWKEGKGKDVKDDMGFIAQEVEEVLPELIGGWKAGEGEPDDLKSVKAGDLIPVLVKAIQELTARVAQLEGN